ncbi:venom factor-like [Mytilus trossulus]|uniref:venom factor-like n=1 Tax=Mytilus trossulus TaxID=6551 RepID=UPI003003E18A
MKLSVILFFFLDFLMVYSEPIYFITAPSVFRLDAPETVSVSISDIDNISIQLYIQDHPAKQKTLYERTVTISSGEVKSTTFILQASDLQDSDGNTIQYVSLVAKSTNGRLIFEKEKVILLSRQSGYIFIQTDKPVYTPNQEVRIRVFPLDEVRRPSTVPVHIDIKNPQGVIVQRKNATYHGSFITDKFLLPSRPFYGNNWTVQAKFTNGLETETVVTFEVKEYVLPKFSITLKSEPDIILPTTEKIRINVSANYFHGKAIDGTCVLSYGIITDGQHKISDVDLKKQMTVGSTDFEISKNTLEERFPSYWFPDGARLYLEVTILDKGTGRREQVSDKKTVFSNHPYKISVEKSQKYFKPGIPYDLVIDTFYANGKPAPNCPLSIHCGRRTTNGNVIPIRHVRRLNVESDENGRIVMPIHIENRNTALSCTIKTDADRNNYAYTVQSKVTLVVEAMQSPANRFLSVKPMLNDGRLVAQVSTRRLRSNEFYHLLISGGRILSVLQSRGSNSFLQAINSDMAPNLRIVTYAFNQWRGGATEVAADSATIEVAPSCHHQELEIMVPNTEVSPKSVLTINVTGPPLSKVGFLAIDKAVYQISDKNRIRKEKMFSSFGDHDLGCSVGGGINVNKVFEDAGLSVLTNAEVQTSQRDSVKCPTTGRRKRSINPSEETNPCCQAGRRFAFMFGQTGLLSASDCYTEGQKLQKLIKSSKCAKSFYRCCKSYEDRLSDAQSMQPHGMLENRGDFFEFDRTVVMSQEEEYTFRDINMMAEDVPIRSFFPESWLFEENSLDASGALTRSIIMPDSTTTHVLQAVSLSPLYGMCVAQSVDVISTKDFFVDLDLPYSVVRMEQTEIRATLHNYRSIKLPCHVRLLNTEGVCSTEQDTIRIEIEPNNVQLVRFPIVPMRAGEFTIDVIVLCYNVGDRVKKTLRVVNEGREEKKTVSFWLDPKGQRKHYHDESDLTVQVSHPFHSLDTQLTTVDLALPEEAIPGTGQCKVSAIGNIMDAAVQTVLGGVGSLLDNIPHGCGEQTMILMAPLVYAMRYLHGTTGLTPQAENRGKFFMKVGYQRELAFRKQDGSFSVWQHRPSSTWLTAFVIKVFCQAKTYIDIDQNIICTGMQWLFTKQNANGSFSETSPVYHKEIMGGINGETSLTAFVLISLLECDCRLQGTSDNIRKAVDFLENQILSTNHPYSLSIAAYALALANSNRKHRINRKLQRYSKFVNFPGESNKGYRYWPIEFHDHRNQTDIPYWYRKNPSAVSIETTSYALLAHLELNNITYSHNIVEWLVEQQQASGAFVSTQDTIVGLQALSMYNVRTYAEDVNMRCTLTSGHNSTFREHLNLQERESMVEKSVHDIPATGKLHVTTQGRGVARMEVEFRYNVNDTERTGCKFDINIEIDDIDVDILQEKQSQRDQQCDVCGKCEDIIDYDVVLDRYNVPDPDPRIGFSNQNVNPPPDRVQGPRPPSGPSGPDLLNVDLSGEVDIETSRGRSGRGRSGQGQSGRRRINGRRSNRRRTGRSARRRGASRQQKCMEICVSYMGNEILDMPVIDVGLPTGYVVEEEDLKKVTEEDFIDSFDVSKRAITFYLQKIPQEEICFKLRMIMDFEVENLQSAKVEVYDYSKKDERCVKFYSLQYEVAELDVFCSKENCHCVEGECAEIWDNKLKGSLIDAAAVYDMTCHGYDYVLRIKVSGARIAGNHIVISTVIQSVINTIPDRSDLTVDSEVDFWINLRCTIELLESGHYYIIYGNGGYHYIEESGTERYRYYLQGDSIIMKDYTREMYNPEAVAHLSYWKRFFTRMETHIRTNGC